MGTDKIGIAITLLAYAGGWIWWAATLTGKVSRMIKDVEMLKGDAQRYMAVVTKKYERHETRLSRLEAVCATRHGNHILGSNGEDYESN